MIATQRRPNGKAILAGLGDMALSRHDIPVNVTRYFTDVNGTVVAKATVPAALQVSYPFFMWGKFDMAGGYRQGLAALPLPNGVVYVRSFVNGMSGDSADVTGVNVLSTIQTRLQVGDIIHVYTDSYTAPTYYIWIVQSDPAAGWGSIVGNTLSTQEDDRFNRLFIDSVVYVTANVDQWNDPILILRSNNIGMFRTDKINPLYVRVPANNYLNTVLEMGLKFKVDQYLELCSYFQFATDTIQFVFKMLK